MGILILIYFVLVWLVHAVVATFLVFPIAYIGRRRVRWYNWELLAFVLPFGIWLILYCLHPLPSVTKGINNINEASFISVAIGLAALIRVATGRMVEFNHRVWAGMLLMILCIAAVVIYFATPNLGGSIGC